MIMKKERCFYLDFVRALAVVIILMTHYNANYIYMGTDEALKKAVITTRVANIYIGDFGVALFLIISGAALMYTYEDKLELLSFYKKRFISIFPMFWLCYFIAFSYSFIINGGINSTAPKWSILLTLIGMDGYLGTAIPSFYLVGEWFLGFIIIMYIIFPLMRLMLNRVPVVFIIVSVCIYSFFICYYHLPFIKNIFLFIRLGEVVFGMVFVKFIKKVDWKLALISFVVLVLNGIIKPNIDESLQMTYVGIAAFLMLAYVGEAVKNKRIIKDTCVIISKYSYAVFLTHHFIINCFAGKVNMYELSVVESYIFFVILCIIIAFFSKLLYESDKCILTFVRKYC